MSRIMIAMDVDAVRAAAKAGHSQRIFREWARKGITFDSRLGKMGLLSVSAEEIDDAARWDESNPSVMLACDAQPELVGLPNSGIPAWLTNYFDPRIINISVAPMQATEIVGAEEKKGDWTTTHAQFISVELTGTTAAYGDFDNSGSTNANLNFPIRQSFLYQTFSNWGELQMARAGNARVDWANKVNEASILVLNKYQNASYFYGVAGIPNYGLLNDPNLYASIAATAPWNSSTTTPEQVYEDIRRLYLQMQFQSGGTIRMDAQMTLAMSNTLEPALDKTNSFGLSARKQLSLHFKNLKIKTAVEYQTGAGQLVQLICNKVNGQETAVTAYTEKLRAHAVVVASSSWSQKKSQGTFGTVIFNETAISSLIGA